MFGTKRASFSFLFLFLCIQLLCNTYLLSQSEKDTTTTEKVLVENADNSITEVKDDVSIQYLRNNVRLVHDSIYMLCDSARIQEDELMAVGEVLIVQDDTINVFSDSLIYNSENKIAELFFGVVLENGSKQLFTEHLIYELEDKKAFFYDTTTLLDGTMTLSSLKGSYDVQNKSAKFYEQVSIIDGELRLKTDSLLFDTSIDRAYFLGPTFITQGADKIYCEDGYYDIKAKRAYFSEKAKLYNESQTATGEYIRYEGGDSLLIVSGNAFVEDSLSIAKGDEITKNSKTGDVVIEGNAYYQTEEKIITGPYIKYNEKTESLLLEGRSLVRNKNGTIEGDTINYNKKTDFGKAVGNAIWRDTVENIRVDADVFEYNESSSYYKAIYKDIRPVFMQKVEEDTMYLSADTLINGSIGDSINYLQAIRSVKIFKSDLQAVCDSLYYSDVDSTFNLYVNPISWSDTTQFLGDTLSIKLTNDNVTDIIASNNAFISSIDFDKYYNQIKGRYIHSYLDSNVLERMLIKGNSESLYMIKDSDEKYIGPNYTACSHMMFYFENEELQFVDYYTEPTSVMTPMIKAGDSDLYLDGFKWHGKLRPKDKNEIRKPMAWVPFQEVEKSEEDVFEQEVKDAIFNQEKPLENKRKKKRTKKQDQK